MQQRHYRMQSPVSVGLGGRCPRCGEGALFEGYLRTRKSCKACGLDFAFADSGDGPGFFIILIVGFIVGALFLYVELVYQPPYWLHAALWIPTILILALGLLRPLKGVMIATQYQNQAREGRIDEGDNSDA